jgi:hypothetical protein
MNVDSVTRIVQDSVWWKFRKEVIMGVTQMNLPFAGKQSDSDQSQKADETTLLTLSLTGNPWTDMGIVSLCQQLNPEQQSFLSRPVVWTEHEVIISVYSDVDSMKEMEIWFYDMLRGRWNEIFWLSKPAKVLNQKHVFKEGFIDESAQFPLTKEQKELIKDKLNGSSKDSEKIAQMRLNYIGTPQNAVDTKNNLKTTIGKFVESWITQKGKKYCDLCGRLNDDLETATQSINPLLNKHHNVKIREFASGNTYYQICPICYLTNLCNALNKNIPFVYSNKQRTLILPDISDLKLLSSVITRLDSNLLDLNTKGEKEEGLHTSTNIRDYWWHDPHSLSLVLFHHIFYRFSNQEYIWDPIAFKRESIPHLNRWLIIPFTKPQNVRFGNIHVVEVNYRLYDFIKPIPLNDGTDLRLVPDILSRMKPKSKRPDGILVIRHLCQSIATSDTALLNTALFELYKLYKPSDALNFHLQAGRSHPVRLLPQFVQYFLEVNEMLDKELRNDIRALGTSIGLAFSHDVTLISKLYNVSNESAFRAVLNQILFRLYKLSTSGKATQDGKLLVESQGESREVTRISQERVTNILDQLSEESWKEMAETLSTFACLSAFNANFFKSKT